MSCVSCTNKRPLGRFVRWAALSHKYRFQCEQCDQPLESQLPLKKRIAFAIISQLLFWPSILLVGFLFFRGEYLTTITCFAVALTMQVVLFGAAHWTNQSQIKKLQL